MTVDLQFLSPPARIAAFETGTDGWGLSASAFTHATYLEPVSTSSRKRCRCGCGGRATHVIKANGVALGRGCDGYARKTQQEFNSYRD